MSQFNEKQKEALNHRYGPLLVLAGAGSGKTKVVTHKIARLIEKDKISPEAIAAITFTNKAAQEMETRLKKIIRLNKNKPYIGTFHSLGLKFLRSHYDETHLRKGFSIIDEKDCLEILADLSGERRAKIKASPFDIKQIISGWKSKLLDIGDLPKFKKNSVENLAKNLVRKYNHALSLSNLVDFDDLISLPIKILLSNNEIREKWEKRFEYIMVDEYQDTNYSQYQFTKVLSCHRKNLMIVGDDDQSIYSWRGALPENLKMLESDFSNLKIIKLEQNYRSTGRILNISNHLIKNNPHEHLKVLWSDKGYGDKAKVLVNENEYDETEKIISDINYLIFSKKYRFDSFAILMRSNHQARLFEKTLQAHNIPYVISGARSFFDYKEVRDLICYMRLVANLEDNNALLRILNKPRRGIGQTTINLLMETSQIKGCNLARVIMENKELTKLARGPRVSLQNFIDIILEHVAMLDDKKPHVILESLIKEIDYIEWLADEVDTERQLQKKKENVKELVSWIKRLDRADENRNLTDIISILTLIETKDRKEEDNNFLSLATIHSVKGLEFDNVYLAGFEEELIPHKSCKKESEIEEERRLAYVAITRARKNIAISYCKTRKKYGERVAIKPSRFLDELPTEEFVWSDRVLKKKTNKHNAGINFRGLRELLKD